MANFLKDLPCKNADNFTRINPDTCHRSTTTKKATYIPVKDIPADQVIVTEKTNILLRYLHQQWDKKAGVKKRTGEATAGSEESAKKPRLETLPDTSNTNGSSGVSVATSRTSGLSSSSGGPPAHPPPAYPGTSSNSDLNRFANQQ